MKLEMGESLIYSWLRHVKACKIVQTNWKPSTSWELKNLDELEPLLELLDESFKKEFGGKLLNNSDDDNNDEMGFVNLEIPFEIFKKNTGLTQLIKQGECDLIGLSIEDNKNYFYAVEVAFHTLGLNYGSKDKTTAKVLEKMARAAFCLKGFFNTNEGEIIFAAPKIFNNVEELLVPAVDKLQSIFNELDLNFRFKLMHNETFKEKILTPVIKLCNGGVINDTSELFSRSIQLYGMFYNLEESNEEISTSTPRNNLNGNIKPKISTSDGKKAIGKLANEDFRVLLEKGAASEEDVQNMQNANYSKDTFHLNYPVLSKIRDSSNENRYYAKPLLIRGEEFFICNDWYEKSSNNDRPYLEKWLTKHGWKN